MDVIFNTMFNKVTKYTQQIPNPSSHFFVRMKKEDSSPIFTFVFIRLLTVVDNNLVFSRYIYFIDQEKLTYDTCLKPKSQKLDGLFVI